MLLTNKCCFDILVLSLSLVIVAVLIQPCHYGWCPAWRCWWWRGRGWRGWPWCLTWSKRPEVHHVTKWNSWERKQILFYQNCKYFLCGQIVTCPATLECSLALISKTNPDWMSEKYRKAEYTLHFCLLVLSYLLRKFESLASKTRILPRRNKELSIQNAYQALIQDQRKGEISTLIWFILNGE